MTGRSSANDRDLGAPDADGVRQQFVYDLLTSLDRRRSAVDSRCGVVFAISGVALGLFMGQMKPGQFLYYNDELWRVLFCITSLVLLFAACILGLSLIAPVSRSRKEKREQRGTPSLSWFYRIAEGTEDDYCELVKRQTSETVLRETSSQVHKISRILKKRYDRLDQTCRLLYAALGTVGAYVAVIFLA